MNQIYQEITAAFTWPIGDLKPMEWPELMEHWNAAREVLKERLKASRKAERKGRRN